MNHVCRYKARNWDHIISSSTINPMFIIIIIIIRKYSFRNIHWTHVSSIVDHGAVGNILECHFVCWPGHHLGWSENFRAAPESKSQMAALYWDYSYIIYVDNIHMYIQHMFKIYIGWKQATFQGKRKTLHVQLYKYSMKKYAMNGTSWPRGQGRMYTGADWSEGGRSAFNTQKCGLKPNVGTFHPIHNHNQDVRCFNYIPLALWQLLFIVPFQAPAFNSICVFIPVVYESVVFSCQDKMSPYFVIPIGTVAMDVGLQQWRPFKSAASQRKSPFNLRH